MSRLAIFILALFVAPSRGVKPLMREAPNVAKQDREFETEAAVLDSDGQVEGNLVDDSNADDMSDMMPEGLSDECERLMFIICHDTVCQEKCFPLTPKTLCSNACRDAMENSKHAKGDVFEEKYLGCLRMVWEDGEDREEFKSDACEHAECYKQRKDVCPKPEKKKKKKRKTTKKKTKQKGMLEEEHMIANGSLPGDDATSLDEALAGKRSC